MSAPIPKFGALLVVMSTACGDPLPVPPTPFEGVNKAEFTDQDWSYVRTYSSTSGQALWPSFGGAAWFEISELNLTAYHGSRRAVEPDKDRPIALWPITGHGPTEPDKCYYFEQSALPPEDPCDPYWQQWPQMQVDFTHSRLIVGDQDPGFVAWPENPRPALAQVDLSTGAIDFGGVYDIQFVQHGAIRTARAVVRTSFRRP